MAVLVRSGRRDLPSLQRALLAAGIPTEIARDDIPLALTPAVRPLLDVLRAAAGVDGGLTAERAADLLCSPLGGLDARRLARPDDCCAATRRRTARPHPPTQLVADSLRDPDLLGSHRGRSGTARGRPGVAAGEGDRLGRSEHADLAGLGAGVAGHRLAAAPAQGCARRRSSGL